MRTAKRCKHTISIKQSPARRSSTKAWRLPSCCTCGLNLYILLNLWSFLAVTCYTYWPVIDDTSRSNLCLYQSQHLLLVGCPIHRLELIQQFLVGLFLVLLRFQVALSLFINDEDLDFLRFKSRDDC